jgi:hypothetical protein
MTEWIVGAWSKVRRHFGEEATDSPSPEKKGPSEPSAERTNPKPALVNRQELNEKRRGRMDIFRRVRKQTDEEMVSTSPFDGYGGNRPTPIGLHGTVQGIKSAFSTVTELRSP